MSIKINTKSIINFVFSFFLVLSCNTIIYYNNEVTKYLFVIVLFIFFCTNFLLKKKVTKKSFLVLSIYYLAVTLYGLSRDMIFGYIFSFMVVLPALYLSFANDGQLLRKEILDNILNIVVVLALLSFVFYFLGPVLEIIKPTGSVLNLWTSNENVKNYIDSYYNLHYYTQYTIINGAKFVRNSSIFTEAPMFSLVLTSALAIEFFVTESKSNFRKIVLLFAILTTFSTTGILISLIMVILNYLTKRTNRFGEAVKVYVFPLILITAGCIIIILVKDKMSTSSYFIRMDDYVACIRAWCDHPIFGNGMFNNSAIIHYMENFRNMNQGLSNSLFVLLAQGGIYFTSIYIIPIVNAIKYSCVYAKNIFWFIIIMLILFVTTIFHFTPLALCLVAMAMSLSKRRQCDEAEKYC